MALVLACVDYDSTANAGAGACLQEQWIAQTGVLPPLPAAEGMELSGAVIGVCAIAWGFKALRRYIWPRA